MSRGLAVILAALGGGLASMQAPVNSRLARNVGTIQAAAISFTVGALVLIAIAIIASGGLGEFARAGRAPWWAWIGGLLGAVYVTAALIAVRVLGASGVAVAIIAGQLTVAVMIDRFGLFGISAQQITLTRTVGLLLLLVGVVLVVRH